MKDDLTFTGKEFEAIKAMFEMHKEFCNHQQETKNGGCDSCPNDILCGKGIYEKVLNIINSKRIGTI